MPASGSVSEWIEELKSGDRSAATHLWNRYHQNLLVYARRRLHKEARRVTDEEDLAATAFESFFSRIAAGQVPELSGRNELWALLLTIADRKAVNTVRHCMARKRGGGTVRGESTFSGESDDVENILAGTGNAGLSPDLAACLSEMLDKLDDEMRPVVYLRMDGYTNEEISQRLNLSLATIERRLRLLRDQWLEELLG